MNQLNKNIDNKKTSKFKSIFRSQIDTTVNNYSRKPSINRLEISPPILQHSTSIFSLVSPIRSNNRNPIEGLYQAQSPAPEPPSRQKKQLYHSISAVVPSKKYESMRHKSDYTKNQDKVNKTKKGIIRRHSVSSSNPYKQQTEETSNKHINTLRKLTERQNNKVEPNQSSSTPSKKLKPPVEKDKLRKMQELEDLITGRRASTIRFTLTPKGLK